MEKAREKYHTGCAINDNDEKLPNTKWQPTHSVRSLEQILYYDVARLLRWTSNLGKNVGSLSLIGFNKRVIGRKMHHLHMLITVVEYIMKLSSFKFVLLNVWSWGQHSFSPDFMPCFCSWHTLLVKRCRSSPSLIIPLLISFLLHSVSLLLHSVFFRCHWNFIWHDGSRKYGQTVVAVSKQ